MPTCAKLGPAYDEDVAANAAFRGKIQVASRIIDFLSSGSYTIHRPPGRVW